MADVDTRIAQLETQQALQTEAIRRILEGKWQGAEGAAGLVVATPTFVAYSYLSSRVNTLLHDMERAGIEVVHMLTDRAPTAEIISFQQAQTKAAEQRFER